MTLGFAQINNIIVILLTNLFGGLFCNYYLKCGKVSYTSFFCDYIVALFCQLHNLPLNGHVMLYFSVPQWLKFAFLFRFLKGSPWSWQRASIKAYTDFERAKSTSKVTKNDSRDIRHLFLLNWIVTLQKVLYKTYYITKSIYIQLSCII